MTTDDSTPETLQADALEAWANAVNIEQTAELKTQHARRIKGAAVRTLRRQGLSLRAVAELLDVSPPTVQKYEQADAE